MTPKLKQKKNMAVPVPEIRVGILGGGQLARMLVIEGQQLGLKMRVLSTRADDPAAMVTNDWTKGDPSQTTPSPAQRGRAKTIQHTTQLATLRKFMSGCDLITFESEFVNADLLKSAAKGLPALIFPRLSLMQALQDRLSQKSLLDLANVPTAAWMEVSSKHDLNSAGEKFAHAYVLKKRRFGYDGYGTYVVRNEKDHRKLLSNFPQSSGGFIAEKLIPFERELAVTIARSGTGEMRVFPLVETLQKDSRCFWVKGPVQSASFAKLEKSLLKFVENLNYVGVMAFELFHVGGKLLVNEIAPRVHNSAHYSLDGLSIDQFRMHLLCGLPVQLPPVHLRTKGFAMVNLLGGNTPGGVMPKFNFADEVNLHWYGKSESRPGRKMGHVNATAQSPEAALKKAMQATQKNFKV